MNWSAYEEQFGPLGAFERPFDRCANPRKSRQVNDHGRASLAEDHAQFLELTNVAGTQIEIAGEANLLEIRPLPGYGIEFVEVINNG